MAVQPLPPSAAPRSPPGHQAATPSLVLVPARPEPSPLSRWLLGADWKQRLRTRRSLLGGLGYLGYALLLQWAVHQGWLPAEPVAQATWAMAALVALFYAVLRSGLNRQLRDPSLTMPQMLGPASLAAWLYTIAGPWRDGVLMVLAPVLLFGFHHLRASMIRALSVYTLAVIGLAMVWLVAEQPQAYDMGRELVRFMICAAVVFTMWQYTNSADQEDSSGFVHGLMRLVFTQDAKQRLRIQRFMVAAVNFLICTVVLAHAIKTGAVDRADGTLLASFLVGNVVVFYALLRSGLNLRFADPALTLPQILVALVCVVWAYAVLRESRGSALILLALVLTFGMFNLTARQTRMAASFALIAQGLTMLFMTTLAPERYPARQELVNFLFACSSLPTISLLSGQLSDLRARLQARKEELAQALERIQTLATRDELTGLFNRRHMIETLTLQKKFSDRGGRIFCVAILDIDHFKQVNDSYGHGVGDEVLRNFAQHAQAVLRDSDVIARWGGEEFLMMFTDCRLDQAEAGLARVREAINGAAMSSTVPPLRITFSSGLTEQRYEESLDQSIERADQALYRAKHGGRNRTVAA